MACDMRYVVACDMEVCETGLGARGVGAGEGVGRWGMCEAEAASPELRS